MKGKVFLTVDVEDWFQTENLKSVIKSADWCSKELRVVNNTMLLLDLLDTCNTRATFFILGWIAERKPLLVREIHKRGHEVASHGFAHELIYKQTLEQFRNDVRKSKNLIEDCISEKIIGYRAPAFSITDSAIDILAEEGFKYDSSYFPVSSHDRYGKINTGNAAKEIFEVRKDFYEVPLPTLDLFNIRIPWSGGYLRGLPYRFFKLGINRIINVSNYYLFYIHPWEIDYKQPRVENIEFKYKFRHYCGLSTFLPKIRMLLQDFNFIPINKSLNI